MTSAFLTSRDPHAEEAHHRLTGVRFAANGVFEEGVAAVDDDVARRQIRAEFLQRLIDRITCLDHHQDAARTFQRAAEFLQRSGTDEAPFGMLAKQPVNPVGLQVPNRHGMTVVLDIEGEIRAHDPETDDAELRRLDSRFSPAWVSPLLAPQMHACGNRRGKFRTLSCPLPDVP